MKLARADLKPTSSELNCAMAQKNPTTPGRSRSESIADLVDDLKVLRVSPTGYGTDFNSMVKTREERIKELKRANGTLNEVCFEKCN